jgi:multimeric flavodoxin WrbA
MKVILLNGSPRTNGCTFTGLSIIKEQLTEHGVDSEIFQVGDKPVIGCIACLSCKQSDTRGKCKFDDDMVNTVAKELEAADGLIIGSAVHFASATGAITSFLDRLFFSRMGMNKLKFGACIVSTRRAGATAAFDQLNKYFTISQMPIVSSCYWNNIHGNKPEDVYADEEGVRTLKILANNMAYLIKCKRQSGIEPPEEPPRVMTSFHR